MYGNTDLASAYLDLGQDVNATSSMFEPTIVVCFCLHCTHITVWRAEETPPCTTLLARAQQKSHSCCWTEGRASMSRGTGALERQLRVQAACCSHFTGGSHLTKTPSSTKTQTLHACCFRGEQVTKLIAFCEKKRSGFCSIIIFNITDFCHEHAAWWRARAIPPSPAQPSRTTERCRNT